MPLKLTTKRDNNEMVHRKLKSGWSTPPLPLGYTKAVVVIGTSGNVRLDFINENEKAPSSPSGRPLIYSLDSNKSKPKWEWPWVSNFEPAEGDWRALGFDVTWMRDSCFGHPSSNSMFTDWVGKI